MQQHTIVIKIGGGEGINPDAILQEIAALNAEGTRVLLVHGGSHETNQLAERLGHPPRFIRSPSGHTSRRTDRTTLEIFEMAYCGRVNKSIVESLRRLGVDALGLSGLDGGLWQGRRKNAIRALDDEGRTTIIRDDLSGRVEAVDDALLRTLLDTGRTPVLTPPAVTPDGTAINVDADRAAAATAAAIDADELLLLSNVPGVLRNPDDPDSLIHQANEDPDAVRDAARGRMKNKVLAAEEALNGGVARAVIATASTPTPIADARAGRGTVFQPLAEPAPQGAPA